MLFQTQIFCLFFLLVLAIFWTSPTKKIKKIILLISSLIFYTFWNIPYTLILIFSVVFNFYIGHLIWRQSNLKLIILSCVVNLGILFFFKYINFGIENLNELLSYFYETNYIPFLSIILPLGISFYTFQNLSYSIDLYYRKYTPYYSFLDYSVYIMFFPQLIAGPIVRGQYFKKQLQKKFNFNSIFLTTGLTLFLIGVFKKVVLADQASVFTYSLYAQPNDFYSFLTIVGIFAFSIQIYFDFSGYTDMARGIAYCFGIRLPINFLNPYNAVGFRDFWRRWHISLSTWLRDYLYIALGGSKFSKILTLRNLLITMVLGGLWHGAAWNFIFWGLTHGILLCLEVIFFEKSLSKVKNQTFRFLISLLTFIIISLTWVFFRSDNINTSYLIFENIFRIDPNSSYFNQLNLFNAQNWVIGFILPMLIIFSNYFFKFDKTLKSYSILTNAFIICLLIILISITSSGSNEFIYFQF